VSLGTIKAVGEDGKPNVKLFVIASLVLPDAYTLYSGNDPPKSPSCVFVAGTKSPVNEPITPAPNP
jgi:hypothetical protein